MPSDEPLYYNFTVYYECLFVAIGMDPGSANHHTQLQSEQRVSHDQSKETVSTIKI